MISSKAADEALEELTQFVVASRDAHGTVWVSSIDIVTGGNSFRSTPLARRTRVTAAISMSRTRSAYAVSSTPNCLAVVGQHHEFGVEDGLMETAVDGPKSFVGAWSGRLPRSVGVGFRRRPSPSAALPFRDPVARGLTADFGS